MDAIIGFFRDTLDGPVYIVWIVGCLILIFACIGYLAEKGIKNKKEKEKYASVSGTDNTPVVPSVSEEVSPLTAQSLDQTNAAVSMASTVSNNVVDTVPAEAAPEVSTATIESNQVDSNINQESPVQVDNVVPDNSSTVSTVEPVAVVNVNANTDLNDNSNANADVQTEVVQPVVTTVVNEPVVDNVSTTPVTPVSMQSSDVNVSVSIPQITPANDNTPASTQEPSEVVIPTINQDSK